MAPILNQEAGFSDYTYQGQTLASLGDNQLVQLVITGDEDAFAELYHRFSTNIYNYILRLVSNPAVAEDLLQEVFIAVWQGLDSFKNQSTIKTWLFRVAHNKAMSWLRTNYSNQEVDQDESQTASESVTPDVQSVLNWQVELVQQALGQLSANHRAVVELFYFHGMSYSEISEVVICPIGTVKSRMSHALQNLNRILTKLGLES
jgi:RNA polymerase sigma-70 factor (ECF subfamily)